MTSAFASSTHNERIKAVYGNFCFWSWLRYWHIDTPEYITLMLIDKEFYDYDYEAVKEKAERHEQSEERTQRMMDRFGFGKVKNVKSDEPQKASEDFKKAEELQKEILEDLQ